MLNPGDVCCALKRLVMKNSLNFVHYQHYIVTIVTPPCIILANEQRLPRASDSISLPTLQIVT